MTYFEDEYLPFFEETPFSISDYLPRIWRKLPPQAQTQWVEDTFRHWRQHGFPYPVFSERRLEQLWYLNTRGMVEDRTIRQNMAGNTVPSSYMPHMYGTRVGDMKTALEAFEDDVLLRRAITKHFKYAIKAPTPPNLRGMLSMMPGVQVVSNFRPSVARYIWHTYAPEGGTVYDYSCGYGGRMAGALASDRGLFYLGCEPCTETYEGLHRMGSDLFPDRYDIRQTGSEIDGIYSEYDGQVDMAFSSPPYFNREKYSDEPTQSWIKYPDYSDWIAGYLTPTVATCYRLLKPGGVMAINVAAVSGFDIPEDSKNVLSEAGFKYSHEYRMSLSTRIGKGHDERKYEPLYIYKKP